MRSKTVYLIGPLLILGGCAAPVPSVSGNSHGTSETSPSPSAIRQSVEQSSDALSTVDLEAGQTDEQLATDFTQALQAWNNASAETIVEHSRRNSDVSLDEVVADVAQANSPKFVERLIEPASAEAPDVTKFIQAMTVANEHMLKYAVLTDPTLHFGNEENYRRLREIVSPVENVGSAGS